MFLRMRVCTTKDNKPKEILINTATIWKIEVCYRQKNEQTRKYQWASPQWGDTHPEAERRYDVYYGNESVSIYSNQPSPALDFIQAIYKEAFRGPLESPREEASD